MGARLVFIALTATVIAGTALVPSQARGAGGGAAGGGHAGPVGRAGFGGLAPSGGFGQGRPNRGLDAPGFGHGTLGGNVRGSVATRGVVAGVGEPGVAVERFSERGISERGFGRPVVRRGFFFNTAIVGYGSIGYFDEDACFVWTPYTGYTWTCGLDHGY